MLTSYWCTVNTGGSFIGKKFARMVILRPSVPISGRSGGCFFPWKLAGPFTLLLLVALETELHVAAFVTDDSGGDKREGSCAFFCCTVSVVLVSLLELTPVLADVLLSAAKLASEPMGWSRNLALLPTSLSN